MDLGYCNLKFDQEGHLLLIAHHRIANMIITIVRVSFFIALL